MMLVDRTTVTLDDAIRDRLGNIVWMLLRGMRVGIDADQGCLKNWDEGNDFEILSMSSTKDFESVWVDLENQANNKQVTLQIRI